MIVNRSLMIDYAFKLLFRLPGVLKRHLVRIRARTSSLTNLFCRIHLRFILLTFSFRGFCARCKCSGYQPLDTPTQCSYHSLQLYHAVRSGELSTGFYVVLLQISTVDVEQVWPFVLLDSVQLSLFDLLMLWC